MPNLNGTRSRGNEILRYGRGDNPPSPVATYTLTQEELSALSARLPKPDPAWRVYSHTKLEGEASMRITRAQYLIERMNRTSREDICAKYGLTPSGIGGARSRWGISTEAKELAAIREFAGITLTPASDKLSILAGSQEDATAPEAGEEAQEGVASANVAQEGTGEAVEVRTPTREEREGMFAGDAGAWGAEELTTRIMGEWERLHTPSESRYITICIPLRAHGDKSDEAPDMSAADIRDSVNNANKVLQWAIAAVEDNLREWTGSATVEQVQAWVDRSIAAE